MILSISHDIKTPLSTIKLYARALAEHLYDTDERRVDAARRIDEKANEISHSVDAIIQASTGEFLNLPVVDSEFYLERLVTKISEYYTHRLEAAHTHFSIEKYSDCLIRGDFDRMCEVTENFLENAIKYGDGKEISLSFTREEDCILMTVQNSGCTLLSEEVVHIFECFRRGSNSTNINGSGLGLYIARKLCTSMGGEVYAKVSDGIFTVTAVMKRA